MARPLNEIHSDLLKLHQKSDRAISKGQSVGFTLSGPTHVLVPRQLLEELQLALKGDCQDV